MKLAVANYSVEFKEEEKKVVFIGTLRLQGKEQYQEIYDLLVKASKIAGDSLDIDMRELKFLNSSGISSLSLFMIQLRKQNVRIRIFGSSAISWQVKSLQNFQKLYNQVEILIN